MFKHIQLSALAVGSFAGHVVPFLLTLLLGNQMYDAAAVQDVESGRFYFWLMLATNMLGPVVGGHLAARFSRYQPMLHGLLSGVVGGSVIAVFRGFNVGLLIYYAFAGVVGGWLWLRLRRTSR